MTNEQPLAFSRSLGTVRLQRKRSALEVTIGLDVDPSVECIDGSFLHFTAPVALSRPSQRPRPLSPSRRRPLARTSPTPMRRGTIFPRVTARRAELRGAVIPNQARAFWHWQGRRCEVHPIVWESRSGRRLHALGFTARYLQGNEPAESRMLLARLRESPAESSSAYACRWAFGDLLISDNTGTTHRISPRARTMVCDTRGLSVSAVDPPSYVQNGMDLNLGNSIIRQTLANGARSDDSVLSIALFSDMSC